VHIRTIDTGCVTDATIDFVHVSVRTESVFDGMVQYIRH